MNVKINQSLVTKIVNRAKKSSFGLGDGLDYKENHLNISQYANPDLAALSMCLVNGFHDKYDLISIFAAAFEVLEEESNGK